MTFMWMDLVALLCVAAIVVAMTLEYRYDWVSKKLWGQE